jgi:hypothetical protein
MVQIVLEFEILNVPGQKICSHFLVQIPRANAEIVTNKLLLIFFFFINMLLLYFNVQYDKMVYAYLTPDFRKHISRELWYFFVVWSFSVMRFLRPLLKHLMSVRSFVRPSVRFLQSATPLTVTTQWIDLNCIRRKNLITLKDQTTKMYQSSREICLRKSGVRYA